MKFTEEDTNGYMKDNNIGGRRRLYHHDIIKILAKESTQKAYNKFYRKFCKTTLNKADYIHLTEEGYTAIFRFIRGCKHIFCDLVISFFDDKGNVTEEYIFNNVHRMKDEIKNFHKKETTKKHTKEENGSIKDDNVKTNIKTEMDWFGVLEEILKKFPVNYKPFWNVYVGDLYECNINDVRSNKQQVIIIKPKFTHYHKSDHLEITIYNENKITLSPVNGWYEYTFKGRVETVDSIDKMFERLDEYFKPFYDESVLVGYLLRTGIKDGLHKKTIHKYYPNEEVYNVDEEYVFSNGASIIKDYEGVKHLKYKGVVYSTNVYKDVIQQLVDLHEATKTLNSTISKLELFTENTSTLDDEIKKSMENNYKLN